MRSRQLRPVIMVFLVFAAAAALLAAAPFQFRSHKAAAGSRTTASEVPTSVSYPPASIQSFAVDRPDIPALLGMTLANSQGDQRGVPIETVPPDGPAHVAGLKPGDLLVAADGHSLRGDANESGLAKLARHLLSAKPGGTVTLEYVRSGQTRTANIVMPNMAALFATNQSAYASPSPLEPWLVSSSPAHVAASGSVGLAFGGSPDMRLHGMELLALTPKLGKGFGTDKGVLVVKPPSWGPFELEEGDVIPDIDGRTPRTRLTRFESCLRTNPAKR
jgi:hypothetical protein